MKALCSAVLLALCLPVTARAAGPTPVAQSTGPTPTPVTSPVAVATPTVILEPTATPVPESSPIPVTREGSSGGTVEATAIPTVAVQPTPSTENGASPTPVAQPTRSTIPGAVSTPTPLTSVPGVIPGSTSTETTPNSAVPSGTSSDASLLTGVTGNSFSYQAPAQLRCSNKTYPVAAPFLQSPFHGWTDINSFMDHDRPDYDVDGKIIIANGLTATSADGQASDVFPAYWSPALRQYVNYDGHNGYDFGISYQPVFAAAAGTIEYAGWNGPTESSGYGQMILIDHHNGYVTLYGHLSRLDVSNGDKVQAGQEIGISGTTGNSTGPHLHFSVFHNCDVTDPYGWTGPGADPLHGFNGEDSQYLWLPGQDPLVLNPPPSWPTFPQTAKIPAAVRNATRSPVPTADRLLLLKLPAPRSLHAISAGAAMAGTEALVTRESELLLPALKRLEGKHLISSFEVIPAAAAVWIRGNASAQQLESLPGVASLSGVQPKDLLAAQTGVAHSVLMQVNDQSAPTLWPVGYRSALHAWRPVATVLNGQALITGFALPGADVSVVLKRDGIPVGSTEVAADAQNGGFVATVHNGSGTPIETQPHDVLAVETDGRRAAVKIAPFSLAARTTVIRGSARPGATVAVTVAGANRAWSGVTVANSQGQYRFKTPFHLPAGSLVVGSVVDAAGDEEAASAFVPGLDIHVGADRISGWAVSRDPVLTLWRGRTRLFRTTIAPAADESYSLRLPAHHRLEPGDRVELSTARHDRSLTIPAVALAATNGTPNQVSLTAPAGSLAWVGLRGLRNPAMIRVGSNGHASLRPRILVPGTRLSAQIILSGGDILRWFGRVPQVKNMKMQHGSTISHPQ